MVATDHQQVLTWRTIDNGITYQCTTLDHSPAHEAMINVSVTAMLSQAKQQVSIFDAAIFVAEGF